MDYKEDSEFNNYKEPKIFKEKLASLNSQLPAVLDDFKKYYVFYNKNPEYDEYRQMFENMKNNLTKINSDLFVLSNNVESSTDDMNEKLIKLDILIRQEKERNSELKRKLGIVEHKNSASTEMISNYQEMYDNGYLRNWGLLLSILVGILTIKNVYSKRTV